MAPYELISKHFPSILLNLACLYQKACDAEKQAIKANQDEICAGKVTLLNSIINLKTERKKRKDKYL